METDSIEFGVCPNCGSTEYIEDYPVKGKRVCVKCGHENVIELKFVVTGRQISDICPFCGKEKEDDDILFKRDEIIVFKCRKCEKLDGYKFPDFLEYAEFEGAHDSLSVEIAKQEGKFICPASKYQEFAKALRKREKSPIEKCKKQLNLLIHEKNQEMKAAGISYGTIGGARWKARSFIESKGPLTNKQLKSLFPAALLLEQDRLVRRGRIPRKEVTERQLERIFDVTRKTIRKWKKMLQKERAPLKLKILTRQKEGQPKYTVVEIPKEVESVTRLEKPYEDKCDFCEQLQLLCWRIRHANGSWSDICVRAYEILNKFALEYGWKIEDHLHSR